MHLNGDFLLDGNTKKTLSNVIFNNISFTKVSPSLHFQRHSCKSPSLNTRNHLFGSVDNTVSDIHHNRSNARTLLCDVPKASTMEIRYRIHRICRYKLKWKKNVNNFVYKLSTSKRAQKLDGFNWKHYSFLFPSSQLTKIISLFYVTSKKMEMLVLHLESIVLLEDGTFIEEHVEDETLN